MTILILAEHHNNQLSRASRSVVTAAQSLAGDIHLLVAGHQLQSVIEQATEIEGVAKVLVADDPALADALAEPMAELLTTLVDNYHYLLAPSTTFGKNILPRLAALKDVNPISDVVEIISADTFKRPIYAGNAFATVQSEDGLKLLTIRTTAFSPANKANQPCESETIAVSLSEHGSQFIERQEADNARPELTQARVVISGGRGLQSGENFKLLEALADKLDAAIGASRAAVDAGFVPNDYQVGQTGKVVAPELYIAVGISGAVQHLAGMKDSKVIVAINKDKEAPIFKVANYGLVGDLFKLVPELTEKL